MIRFFSKLGQLDFASAFGDLEFSVDYSNPWLGVTSPTMVLPNVFLSISEYSTLWGDRLLADIKQHHNCNCFDPIQRFVLDGEIAISGGVLDDLKQIYQA